ncbi:MAG: hypothetical protein HRS57_02970 [Mycoplasmataceae bacterium]|nr:hypothetical protein [Mycoplasmataceae bacterium]
MNDIYLITLIIIVFIAAMVYYIYYTYYREETEEEESTKAFKNVENTKSKVKKEIEEILTEDEKTKQSIKNANINISLIETDRLLKIKEAKSIEDIIDIDKETKKNIEKELSNIEESTDKLSIIEQKKQDSINKLKKAEIEKNIILQNAKLAFEHEEAKKNARSLLIKKIQAITKVKHDILKKEFREERKKIKDDFTLKKKKIRMERCQINS